MHAAGLAREVLLPYVTMAELNPTGEKTKQKKKSAPPKPKCRARAAPACKGPAVSKAPSPKEPPVVMGRMVRTRRLLLAALRVWELKRRPMD